MKESRTNLGTVQEHILCSWKVFEIIKNTFKNSSRTSESTHRSRKVINIFKNGLWKTQEHHKFLKVLELFLIYVREQFKYKCSWTVQEFLLYFKNCSWTALGWKTLFRRGVDLVVWVFFLILALCILGNFSCLLIFSKLAFSNHLSTTQSEFPMVWIQIRPTFCQSWSWSKPFAKVSSRQKKRSFSSEERVKEDKNSLS